MTPSGGADPDSEFAFELSVCQWAERAWSPADDAAVLVARQFGTKHRRWDTIVLECDPDGLRERATFGADPFDSDLLHVLQNAPADWTYYRDALPDPGYPWRYVRESIHEAADRDAIETRKRGNRIEIRRVRPYPDWLRRVIAIENKPDLNASAARNLVPQLQRDIALSLADEVWVATAATDERVEPILLADLPAAAGVLTVDPEQATAEAVWQPRSLSVDEPGTRILDRPDDDTSAARFEYVDTGWKRERRLAIAERAYARGWRAYADTMRPDCRHFQLTADETGVYPYCAAKDCLPTAAECRGQCPSYEPEPPAWRSMEWPLDGGPGNAIQRVLERRRRRQRPGLSE
ncbi:hypothetical protein SAMN05443574_104231 [Haloarcula vallismortis]|uniref:Uncharacterized protein n=2 Tax=Haloarcula vallismortis TaxID=28442 RepID=M0JDL1_HALVA|nr:DUF5787 family protein [Haloarcula vallismortis]EMA07036.1 hypothetical protein C437_10391 [Haloarcula vallismortis ATCC 29715]SDW55667.1 hypothetical protein SAMN05443574_104231 [Haloarcula vallismortis]